MKKRTLVLGTSLNPKRYSYIAVKRLLDQGIEVIALGNKTGEIFGVKIYTSKELFKDIHTITLYLAAKNQESYFDYIIELNPKRVIFNPGTENVELEKLLTKNKIKYERACTLVLLSLGAY